MDRIRLATTTSTQLVARDLPIGSVVVAGHQSAGRGRRGRSWQAPAGTALLASFVLPVRPLASLAAGVAVAEACGEAARLKWPNDVLVQGRKLAGILVERHGSRCVVGVGVNLTWAPPGAVALGEDRDVLLERVATRLTGWFEAGDGEVLAAWRRLSDTLGRRVRVELAGESFEGVAEAIAGDGALVVSGRTVTAADVIHLRAAAAPEGSRPPGP